MLIFLTKDHQSLLHIAIGLTEDRTSNHKTSLVHEAGKIVERHAAAVLLKLNSIPSEPMSLFGRIPPGWTRIGVFTGPDLEEMEKLRSTLEYATHQAMQTGIQWAKTIGCSNF